MGNGTFFGDLVVLTDSKLTLCGDLIKHETSPGTAAAGDGTVALSANSTVDLNKHTLYKNWALRQILWVSDCGLIKMFIPACQKRTRPARHTAKRGVREMFLAKHLTSSGVLRQGQQAQEGKVNLWSVRGRP